MARKLALSLRTSVLLVVAAGLLVPAILVLPFAIDRVRHESDERIERQLDQYASILELGAREPLWSLSPQAVSPLVEALLNNPDVVSISIVDATAGPLMTIDRVRPGSKVRYVQRSVSYRQRDLGTVRIGMTGDSVRAEQAHRVWVLLVLTLVQLSLAAVLIFLFLRRRLVQPLERLGLAADRLASGELRHPVPQGGEDEIGRLAARMEGTRRELLQLFAELQTAREELEARVTLRTHDLAAANREQAALLERLRGAQAQLVQSEKLAALGSLVAGIAHELNTPIGNCLMAASTLEDQRRDFVRETEQGLRRSQLNTFLHGVGDATQSLVRNLQRAADLVVSFKQVAVDQTSSQRRRFDLQEIAHEIEVTLAPSFRKSRCRFVNAVPASLRFDSFPGPLGQVITNLATNAITHGLQDHAAGEFRLDAQALGASRVRLVCSDNGQGIPAEHLPRIFDPFFTTRLGTGGSGLGLHIAYNIVTGILGGTISVESTPGQGARFVLDLPLEAPHSEEESRELQA
ncbi:ATP-binding protein [Niveibacterium sp. SC-1]|uniref:sensor histidine kinase n=1 Tax=Niveibacterium sp. SC-1 TaxID=3135646 RepID=UPI00311D7E3E